ncbi:hypothetical protein J2045_003417 [Peteryoungia aggregata LMG 23059]|uniref:Uncharacterized protein n=1 Tax=Peteryoungia aggregata LMG 23059 TaxID=1368425 RepID=A0ABU0GAJ1_9HYPH|nr:hypothetical protein [Peteryoungia aggregata LMG 23059]
MKKIYRVADIGMKIAFAVMVVIGLLLIRDLSG